MKKTLDYALIGIAALMVTICAMLAFKQDDAFLHAEAVCQKHGGALIDSSSGFYCLKVK